MRNITSRQNPIVRTFREAADAPGGDGTRVLLDGVHLVRDAHAMRVEFEVIAFARSKLDGLSEEARLARTLMREDVDVVVADDRVFDALSPAKTPSGVVAIARRRAASLPDICPHPDAFVLAAVDVQDPGNVGALLRAAEAGGVTGAIVCGVSASPFSWKALRGSMGSALRMPVVAGIAPADALACLKRAAIRTVAAVPRSGLEPDAVDWRGGVGLLLGGEGAGLPDHLVSQCDARVTVPMAAPVESLNVAVAGAILIYAARRQRLGASGRSQGLAEGEGRTEGRPLHATSHRS